MITIETASGLKLIDARRESSAANAYKARQANISILLAALNDRLRDHAQRATAEPRHWGHDGDLGHVQEQLEEITNFLAGAG